MSRSRLAAVAFAAMLAAHPAAAQSSGDCASQIQQVEEQSRTQYINGMSSLARNNFSQRQGSYTQMACLDKFMQGNMDTFFRPPQLSGLLSQVMSFACQQAQQAMGGAMGNATNLQGLIGSLAGGGINIQGLIGSLAGGGLSMGGMGGGGGGIVNLSQTLGGATSLAGGLMGAGGGGGLGSMIGGGMGGGMGGGGGNFLGGTINQLLRGR
jgi:hypothetical protein